MNKLSKFAVFFVIIILVAILIYALNTITFEDCDNLDDIKCKFNPKCKIEWVPAGPNLPAYEPVCVDRDLDKEKQESAFFGTKYYGRFEGPQKEGECVTDSQCFRAGCSGEVCTAGEENKDITTTCEAIELPEELSKTSCKCVQERCIWTKTEIKISRI